VVIDSGVPDNLTGWYVGWIKDLLFQSTNKRFIKIDDPVKSLKTPFSVIPAEAGI